MRMQYLFSLNIHYLQYIHQPASSYQLQVQHYEQISVRSGRCHEAGMGPATASAECDDERPARRVRGCENIERRSETVAGRLRQGGLCDIR